MTQVLVDTSVWIDFLRLGDTQLADLLETSQVSMHSMVAGELACGNLRQGKMLLTLWKNLPGIVAANHGVAGIQ